MTRRPNQFLQERFILAFDHDPPGQAGALSATAATGTITADTKANTTQGDWFLLRDGQATYAVELDVGGTGAVHSITPTAATATITCDTKANTTDDDFFVLTDGTLVEVFELDVDSDTDPGTTGTLGTTFQGDLAYGIDISGATTAADCAALLVTAINNSPLQMTAVQGTGGDTDKVFLTQDRPGTMGNVEQSGLGTTLHNAWAVTDFSGGIDADIVADYHLVVDISGATTAADIGALLETDINASDIQMTATDNTDGTVGLENDNKGSAGNTQQSGLGTLHNAWAVTDMAGGALADETGATAATKLFTAQRPMRVDAVEYINPTGIAGHAANFWDIGVKKGATVVAEWSTDSAAEGTIAADTPVSATLSSTPANLVFAKDDVISFYATKNASAANLAAGRIVLHGRYL